MEVREGRAETGPHWPPPEAVLWSPLPRAGAAQFMVYQVPGAQGDRWGGVIVTHTPQQDLCCTPS